MSSRTREALGYAEDSPAETGDTGLAMLAVRRDAASASVSADGDYTVLSTDSSGSLRVALTIPPGAGGLTDAELRASPVPVSATDLDIRNLTFAADKADVSGSTGVGVTGPLTDAQLRAAAVPVSAASLPLPSGASTEATLATRLSESDFDTKTGSLTETAPATDTASSGLNGRLQRIAQRLTSLITLLPAALVGGRLDTNNGAWLGSTAPTVAQKAMASSLPVVIASDQSAVAVSGPLTLTQVQAHSATLGITVTGALAAATTLTIPAAGAGLFHYISLTHMGAATTAAVGGVIARLVITTTNLPGGPNYFLESDAINGGIYNVALVRTVPVKSSVANTATTIVGPATTGVRFNFNVEYYTGV